jgi:hypothetical protein
MGYYREWNVYCPIRDVIWVRRGRVCDRAVEQLFLPVTDTVLEQIGRYLDVGRVFTVKLDVGNDTRQIYCIMYIDDRSKWNKSKVRK